MANVPTMNDFQLLQDKVDRNQHLLTSLNTLVKNIEKMFPGALSRIELLDNNLKTLEEKVEFILLNHCDEDDEVEVKVIKTPGWLVNGKKDRRGHFWAKDEEAFVEKRFRTWLVDKVDNKYVPGCNDLNDILEDIGDNVGRSGGAIKCRLEHLGYYTFGI